MFEIEKGKSIIKASTNKGITAFLRSMQINDSFVCPADQRGSILMAARQAKIKVITGKESPGMIRVERLE